MTTLRAIVAGVTIAVAILLVAGLRDSPADSLVPLTHYDNIPGVSTSQHRIERECWEDGSCEAVTFVRYLKPGDTNGWTDWIAMGRMTYCLDGGSCE